MVPDPVRVLIEDQRPSARVAAHCALAERAEREADLAKALRHYREAVLLSPKNPSIVARVEDLEACLLSPSNGRASRSKGMIARWVGRSR